MCTWVCLENAAVWFRPPIDLVYSTRLSCSDCKQNFKQTSERWSGKIYTSLFWFAKTFAKSVILINSECQSRNTVMFASTSGKNLYKGRNNAVPLYIKFVCQQIMCIIFHLIMAFRIYIERKTIYRHSISNHIKSNPDTYIQINIIFF